MRKLLLPCAMLIAISAAAPAQQLILSGIGSSGVSGMYRINWPSTTTIRMNTTACANVRTWVTNLGTNFVTNTSPAQLKYLTPTASPSTSRTYSSTYGICSDFEAGQNNDLYGIFTSGRFMQIWPSTVVLTTVAGQPNAVTRDGNGDFIVATYSGTIVRINGTTFAQSTLRTGTPLWAGIEYIPSTGGFVGAASTGAYLMTSTGFITRTLTTSIGFVNACCVDEVRNRIFIASNTGLIREYTTSGGLVRSIDYGSQNWSGIDIYRDKKVRLSTTGTRGTVCSLGLNFPGSASRAYCCALSLGQRPQISFSTFNNLNLRLDRMFLLTACGALPYFTSGFVGTLSSSNTGSASFNIPSAVSAGTRIYVGAVAVNPSAPDGLDTGPVMIVKTR